MPMRALVLVLVVLPAAVQAAPRWVRLGFSDPDVTTRFTVSWNTEGADEPTQVEVGKGVTYALQFQGQAKQLPGGLGWLHEVELTGLAPDSQYHYRVGGPGAWSDDFVFRTLPADPCAPIKLVFLGDGRSDDDAGSSPRWPGIVDEALSYGPALALHSGDIVKDGAEWPQWQNHLEQTAPYSPRLPIGYTQGNHDDDSVEGDGALYNQVFAHPRNTKSGTEDYYFLRFGDVIVVGLSTQTYQGGAYAFEEQATWLDQVLTANPARWKIVFFHHPAFTASLDIGFADVGHPPNENNQNPALLPVFDKHHVDLVFAGHNHFYERFKPMRQSGGDPAKGDVVGDPSQGTIHVVTGGAGAFTYVVGMAILCGLTPGNENCNGNHHFVLLGIEGDTLTYTARQTKEQILGASASNAVVIDTFTVTKPGGTVCATGPEPQPEAEADASSPSEPAPEVVGDAAPDSGPAEVAGDTAAACVNNAQCAGRVAPGACPGYPACEAGACVWRCTPGEPDAQVSDAKHPGDAPSEAEAADTAIPAGTLERDDGKGSGSSCGIGSSARGVPLVAALAVALLALTRRRRAR